jgi:hypothetical protein
MDILWGASVLLSLAGGYLLILAVCAILGLLLGIPAMIVGQMQRAPYRQKRAEVPPAGRKEKIVTSSLVSIAWLIIAILALVWVR